MENRLTFKLPKLGKEAIKLPHFPTRMQAFIFRAYEYVSVDKIAAILICPEEKVRIVAAQMGLFRECTSRVWLEKGYITIIRRMWHILPFEQLLELLEMDEQSLAIVMREEDFLDFKLQDKPVCEKVQWEELTQEQLTQTEKIRAVMEQVEWDGVPAFSFEYDVKQVQFSGKQVFDLRMVYPFSGLYQHAFDVDSSIYCPDEMLEAYQKVGINAVWTQGILYQLTEFPFAPELSVGYQERLKRLKEFTERSARYGIKVMLYLNEPRSMTEAFFEKYPKLRGHRKGEDKISMCTSTKEVQDYLSDSVEAICRAVPLLGGFLLINRNENLTNCYSHATESTCTCPRCSKRSVSEVIAEVIGCIEAGAHRVDLNKKVIAWSWNWDEYNIDIINKLPQNVVLMSQSELDVPFSIGRFNGKVYDYSMGIIGPGERAKMEWAAASSRGLKTAAKIQINTTWEASTVPAIPVYPLIEKHIDDIRKEGVTDLLFSWTLGGYPSMNIRHAAKYFYERSDIMPDNPSRQKAAELFSEALQEFPFSYVVLYFGPQNPGPSALLFTEPTGYAATMTCYTYDDLKQWRDIYPEDVFEEQFARMCSKWFEGLKMLKNEPEDEMVIMANAVYCLFWSSLNQIRFYRAREKKDRAVMKSMAQEEIVCAKKMLKLMNKNAAIGFEAANHYWFSKGCLCEKLVNCNDVISRLEDDCVWDS